MVATSATRDAANADDFRTMVVPTLGVAPEVVTGDEEARLSFTGAVRGLPADGAAAVPGRRHRRRLDRVRPRGDGADAGRVRQRSACDIGCVRMTERHLRDDPPTPEQVAAAEADITAAVDRALQPCPAQARAHPGRAGRLGHHRGRAGARPDCLRPERIHHARIPYADVAAVTADLLAPHPRAAAARCR